MKRRYDVFAEAMFVVTADSPEDIKRRLRKLLKENGFDESNFEFGISLHKEAKTVLDPVAEPREEIKNRPVARKAPKKKVAKRRKK